MTLVEAYSSDEELNASSDIFGLGKLARNDTKRQKISGPQLSTDAAPHVVEGVRSPPSLEPHLMLFSRICLIKPRS